MCWISKNIPELKIAEKDIEVQKVLWEDNNTLRSPLWIDYVWKQGVVQEVSWFSEYKKYGLPSDPHYLKSNGFHSCKKILCKNGNWYSVYPIKLIFQVNDFERIFNAIIPKGSKYYLNEYGEFVSDKLMII